MIINSLPAETNYVTLKLIRDLKSMLGVTDAEFAEFEIKNTGTEVSWNLKANEPKPYSIGSKSQKIIQDALKDLDKAGKLTENHIAVFELFNKEGEN